MTTFTSISRNWLTVIASLWQPKSATLLHRQPRKDIEALSDHQEELQKSLNRIEATLAEQEATLNFIAQHLINRDNY
ncbi:hypothetical protein ANSO36C_07260 [Nostoc cf. commune SO-36]|uniref:Uncharacterized protein n=1 Tax=Nostoc cf. commune SO-36 TaxID=449208 RepID=A0ABM7YWC6_NOSCO|nr:hypothetical protein [Nostoc commune]BDI14924.1 hypothetical protein ANSO36C_07260 [Nostoc cf. commune SO-36]